MENNSNFTVFTLFGILYKKLVWIILAVVLCASLGLGYSFYQNKTTYTATKPVMFVINVTSTNISAYNDVGLAKVYLPDVAVMIKTPTFVEKANERLDIDSNVSGGAIRVVFTEDSLIFNISYTDVSEEMAKQKLAVIIGR